MFKNNNTLTAELCTAELVVPVENLEDHQQHIAAEWCTAVLVQTTEFFSGGTTMTGGSEG